MGARGRNREGTGTGFCQAQFSENGTAFEEKKNYIYIYFFFLQMLCARRLPQSASHALPKHSTAYLVWESRRDVPSKQQHKLMALEFY